MKRLPPLPRRAEVFLRRARQIYKAGRGRPILVFMSGGIDSELMAHFFVKAKIPFTPMIVRYEKNYNDYDIRWAKAWCERHGLGFLEVTTEVEKFVCSKQYLKILKTIRMKHPYNSSLFPAIQSATEAGFICVSGCGEPSIAVEGGKLYEYRTEQVRGLARWLRFCGLRSRYFEFYNAPEIRRLFVEYARKMAGRSPFDFSCERIKIMLYRKHMTLAPRAKVHGLEFLMAERPRALERLHPSGSTPKERRVRLA